MEVIMTVSDETYSSPPTPAVIHIFSEDNRPRGYVLTSENIFGSHGSENLETILKRLLSLIFEKEIIGKFTIATYPPKAYAGQLNRKPSPLTQEDTITIKNIFNCTIKTEE